MEDYLRGVVPRESPASWGDAAGGAGINALRAQAVAARSYAQAENRYPYAKTCDTTTCQVYGGAGLNGAASRTHAPTGRSPTPPAQVMTLGGQVARTEFSLVQRRLDGRRDVSGRPRRGRLSPPRTPTGP